MCICCDFHIFDLKSSHFRKHNKQFCYYFAPFAIHKHTFYLQFVTHLNQLLSFNFQTHGKCNYKRTRSVTNIYAICNRCKHSFNLFGCREFGFSFFVFSNFNYYLIVQLVGTYIWLKAFCYLLQRMQPFKFGFVFRYYIYFANAGLDRSLVFGCECESLMLIMTFIVFRFWYCLAWNYIRPGTWVSI